MAQISLDQLNARPWTAGSPISNVGNWLFGDPGTSAPDTNPITQGTLDKLASEYYHYYLQSTVGEYYHVTNEHRNTTSQVIVNLDFLIVLTRDSGTFSGVLLMQNEVEFGGGLEVVRINQARAYNHVLIT
jgi:hypothetical protein